MNPQRGFKLEESEKLLWWKYLFWEKGIDPNTFKKCQMRDIKDIMDIKNAIESKTRCEKAIQDQINSIKWK